MVRFFFPQKGEALMKTGILRVNNKPLFVVVIGAILALFLFAELFEGEALAALYEAVVTCDDVGYSVTLSPDWGQTWTYDYSNVPVTVTRRRSTINMAPWTDPMSSTWASLGAPTAYVNFSVLWWHQTRYLPGPYITDVYVYTIYNLVINQADCTAPPSCPKTNRYYMYTLVDAMYAAGLRPHIQGDEYPVWGVGCSRLSR
jgi:hypothetical protein